MNYLVLFTIVFFLAAAWYAWRYYKLRREMDEYAGRVREQKTETAVAELQNISSAVSLLVSTFGLRHSALDAERARLATVLEQITDGVLIDLELRQAPARG